MCPNEGVRKRSSLRLEGYDYTLAGAYFITLITHRRQCLFGEIIDGEVALSPFGEVVRDEWLASAGIRREIQLQEDEFVVMPNHIHGIVWIVQDEQEPIRESGGQVTIGVNNECVGATAGRPYSRNVYHSLILHQDLLDLSLQVSRLLLQNISIRYAERPANQFGSGIILTA
jgi:hypothetical protein